MHLPLGAQSARKQPSTMTRKSIESAAKYLVWAIFLFFIVCVVKVLEMMGIFN